MAHPIQKEQYGSHLWLKREIGFALQLSREDGTWNHESHGRVESIVQSGLMQFYYPPPIEREQSQDASGEGDGDTKGGAKSEVRKDARNRMPHSWSFLRGLATLDMVTGKYEYDAPSDFTGINGDLVVSTGEGRLPVVSEEHLRQLLSSNATPGTPKYIAVRPKRSSMQGEQQWEIIVYPRPSSSLSATFRYTIAPSDIGEDNPFPLGGKQHAETILASCLSVAEEREGAIRDTPPGTYFAKFMQRLAASVHLDKQSSRADELTWSDGEESPSEQIKGQIGLHMNFGQNSLAWTETQKRQIEEAMRRGKRRFYIPPPIPGQKRSHSWSFLNPIASLNLVAGTYIYDLPEDFGALDSPITYAPGTNVLYPDVSVVGEQQVRRLLQSSIQASGRPTKAATRVKAGIQEGGTRYEMILWPVPDSDYHLEYRYLVAPGDNVSVLHGGSPHFQTILEACLCEADLMMNKRYKQHEDRFMERLVASVHYDQSLASPKQLGYNRDRSDGFSRHTEDVRSGYSQSGVTYNGESY